MSVVLVSCSSTTTVPNQSVGGSGTPTDRPIDKPGTTDGDSTERGDVNISPLVEYLQQGRSLTEIDREVQILTKKCMESRGWKFQVMVVNDDDADKTTTSLDKLRVYRSNFGYGLSTSGEASGTPADPNMTYLDSLSSDAKRQYATDLEGSGNADESSSMEDGSSGCKPTSVAAVHKGIPLFDPVYASLPIEAIGTMLADTRYQAADGEWAKCMRDRGFEYERSADVETKLSEEYYLQGGETRKIEFRQHELAVAAADLDCYEAHVLWVRRSIELDFIERLVEEGRLPTEARGAQSTENSPRATGA